ncbi:MAG: hypothetical protein HYX65_10265 [Gemmatimonadetes bacterium]|nr:hypothetical protein [Gemmatimonadota bacterium]
MRIRILALALLAATASAPLSAQTADSRSPQPGAPRLSLDYHALIATAVKLYPEAESDYPHWKSADGFQILLIVDKYGNPIESMKRPLVRRPDLDSVEGWLADAFPHRAQTRYYRTYSIRLRESDRESLTGRVTLLVGQLR